MNWLKKIFGRKSEPQFEHVQTPKTTSNPQENPILVFQPTCLECSSRMKEVEIDTRFPLSSSLALCPKCSERHNTLYDNGTLTITRESSVIGDTRPMSMLLTPVTSRNECTMHCDIGDILFKGLDLPDVERMNYYSSLSGQLGSFDPEELLEHAGRLPDKERYLLLSEISKDLSCFNNSQQRYCWHLQALSLKNMGGNTEAKICALKTLLLDLNPNAIAWTWISEWFPEHNWAAMSNDEKRRKLEEILRSLS